MLKLNKAQVEAIAVKVEKALKNKRAERSKELDAEFRNSDTYKAKVAVVEEHLDLFRELGAGSMYGRVCSGGAEEICSMLTTKYITENTTIKVPSQYKLRNDVTLATIDAENVNDLVSSLVRQTLENE